MADLDNLRKSLESNLKSAYSSDEAVQFRQALEDDFSDDVADAFEECAKGNGGGSSFKDCVQQVADDHGLSDSAASSFASNVPDGVMNALMQVGDQWSADDREVVRSIALDANLDTLNRACAEGDYQEVVDELSLDSQPTSFQDCVTLVSEAQDVRSSLKSAWNTDG